MIRFVIENLENHTYYNSAMREFGKINSATLYLDTKEPLKVRIPKLPKGFYTIKKIIVK